MSHAWQDVLGENVSVCQWHRLDVSQTQGDGPHCFTPHLLTGKSTIYGISGVYNLLNEIQKSAKFLNLYMAVVYLLHQKAVIQDFKHMLTSAATVFEEIREFTAPNSKISSNV